MRLSLTCVLAYAAACAACATPPRHAVSTRILAYDDPRLQVLSPAARDDVQIGQTHVGIGYAVDIVSGATQALTVDAVTSATRFTERRHQASVLWSYSFTPELELLASYGASFEPDHTVNAPAVGVTGEILDRMVRVSAKYQLVSELIGRVDDPTVDARALGHRLDVGWTQILTDRMTLTALATAAATSCTASIGCFANPYRYVGIELPGELRMALLERHPDVRYSVAGALRIAWSVGNHSAVHAGYRWFGDQWSVAASTIDAALVTEWLERRLLVRFEARGTVQSRAAFYRSGYTGSRHAVPAYRTADAELAALRNLTLRLHVDWDFGPLRLVGSLGRMWNSYRDFPSFPSRHAWILGVGLDKDINM